VCRSRPGAHSIPWPSHRNQRGGKRAEAALDSIVATRHLLGVSTPQTDRLGRPFGMTSLPVRVARSPLLTPLSAAGRVGFGCAWSGKRGERKVHCSRLGTSDGWSPDSPIRDESSAMTLLNCIGLACGGLQSGYPGRGTIKGRSPQIGIRAGFGGFVTATTAWRGPQAW
jgi:hypothetical protein